MGLSYAPFGDDPIDRDPAPIINTPSIPIKGLPDLTRDSTECNYLVMFFIAGVFLMGFTDALRKR